MAESQSPFMLIPSEIRLMIYEQLFQDRGQKVFEIRNHNTDVYSRRKPHKRTQYRVLGRDLARQSKPTTYQLLTDVEFHTSIMAVNRKIYEESAHMLYANRSFSFGRDIEAIVPFFGDLSHSTRPLVHGISLVKQGSVYTRDFDRCEWANVCEFLRDNMRPHSLKIVVEGGRPSLGWDGLSPFTVEGFKFLQDMRYESMDWVWQLLMVKGIQKLEVESEIHHCPPSNSIAMEIFARFSASIEHGFTDFLQQQMLVGM